MKKQRRFNILSDLIPFEWFDIGASITAQKQIFRTCERKQKFHQDQLTCFFFDYKAIVYKDQTLNRHCFFDVTDKAFGFFIGALKKQIA